MSEITVEQINAELSKVLENSKRFEHAHVVYYDDRNEYKAYIITKRNGDGKKSKFCMVSTVFGLDKGFADSVIDMAKTYVEDENRLFERIVPDAL